MEVLRFEKLASHPSFDTDLLQKSKYERARPIPAGVCPTAEAFRGTQIPLSPSI